ncbi:MAG: transporter substrate-binding domain-containing protein [Mesorhizobium sp.]|uniref:transporter substrate-binding domain-containing protein n=1 Tax=Mesorhizobium sp. TaxID=1871066 RepID=UPI00120CEE66|nr:transporter substrate-binding domain-containing protein [Mesorhizobium sp.]TIL55440.1 MAG: transporter substrate-binding domain-containing protein [Mesorhizobium sp.]
MIKPMTIIAAAASVAVACLTFSSAAHAGAVLDRVLATKTLTVATSIGWPPSSFMNDKGELDGFDVEVAKGIAKQLGVDVKFVTPEWNLVTSGKWAGRWDLTMGQMVPTEERAKKFGFPGMYIYTGTVALVHKDSKATKLSDLDGKRIGVVAGTTNESYANHTLEVFGQPPIQYHFTPGEVKSYEGTPSPYDDLRLGDGVRLDGAITDETQARDIIKAGFPLKIVGEPFAYSPGGIAILHGDKEFSDKLGAAIKSLKDDGALAKLSIKWFGTDYTAAE